MYHNALQLYKFKVSRSFVLTLKYSLRSTRGGTIGNTHDRRKHTQTTRFTDSTNATYEGI